MTFWDLKKTYTLLDKETFFFLGNKSVDCDFSLPLQWSKLMVTVQESDKCKWKLTGEYLTLDTWGHQDE